MVRRHELIPPCTTPKIPLESILLGDWAFLTQTSGFTFGLEQAKDVVDAD